MKVGRRVEDLREEFDHSVATVGNFDGLHIGHMEILSRVVEKAKEIGSRSLLITFDPHPASVLYPARNLSLLTSPERKLEIVEKSGIEGTLLIDFTLEFASKGPKDFLSDVLLPLGVKELFVGHDFAFGAGRKGNVEALIELGNKHGFAVHEISEVVVEGERVGSSRIRKLIEKGEVEQAERLLARPHSINGNVITGVGRGKEIGFPTCNLDQPVETVPGSGIYATRTIYDDKMYDSATHIGPVPTFDIETPAIETHLFEFEQDIHGEKVEIIFYKKLRDTVKFDSAESLALQIKKDCEEVKSVLEKI